MTTNGDDCFREANTKNKGWVEEDPLGRNNIRDALNAKSDESREIRKKMSTDWVGCFREGPTKPTGCVREVPLDRNDRGDALSQLMLLRFEWKTTNLKKESNQAKLKSIREKGKRQNWTKQKAKESTNFHIGKRYTSLWLQKNNFFHTSKNLDI